MGSSPIPATRPVGQAAKTPPFHGGNSSSILLRVTNSKKRIAIAILFLLLPNAFNKSELCRTARFCHSVRPCFLWHTTAVKRTLQFRFCYAGVRLLKKHRKTMPVLFCFVPLRESELCRTARFCHSVRPCDLWHTDTVERTLQF